MNSPTRLLRIALCAVPALLITVAPVSPVVSTALAEDIRVPDSSVEREMDRIVLRNTNKLVKGRIIEVTDLEVRMDVIVAGISAERTFKRSNVISIEFGDPITGGASEMATKAVDEDIDPAKANQAKKVFDDTAKVYLVELEGNFGQHISQTPIREVFEDVDETFDDLVWDSATRSYVVDPEVRDQHIVVFKINNEDDREGGGDGVFRAEDIYPIIEQNRIQKGRRVVMWVEYATGGAVFLALSSPEIYFTGQGAMFFGERFDLEDFDIGDDMVDEKQISLRLGHMVGAVLVGGYKDAGIIVPAMVRSRNWLSVRFEGGNPILTDRVPDDKSWLNEEKSVWSDGQYEWEVLSDNGKGDFEDDENSLFTNDLLAFDIGLATKLNIADGEADTVEDLLYELEVEDNYILLDENGGQDAVDDWSEGIERALDLISQQRTQFGRVRGKILRELADVQVNGDWKERSAARGKQIRLYKQMISTLTQYEEAFDPQGNQRSQLRSTIDQIKLQQQDDPRPTPRPSRRR